MKALEWSQHFYRRSRAANYAVHGRIWPNLELIRDFIVVLVTFKNEEDLINNEDARVFTILNIEFSDAQGQITPESVVGSGRNLNPSKLSCISSLPARMKMSQSKMKGLKWSQHCSHYKSMGIFPCAQGQLTRSPSSDLSKFRTHPYSYGCPNYL